LSDLAAPPPPPPAVLDVPPAPGTPPVPVAGPPSKLLPILAAVFAGVGFLLAIPAPGVAWIFCVTAIVLAIVALVKRRQPRGLAIAAIIVAPIAWLIAIIVAVAGFASSVGDAIEDAPSVSQPDATGDEDAGEADTGEGAGPKEAAIGDTVTNGDNVSFTVSAVTCGLATAGDNEYLQEAASGQFCEVRFTLANGSDESISVYSGDVTGTIGDATYEANDTASRFGDDYYSTDINPGLSADCIVYIDIPTDKKLEFVTYSPFFSFGGDVVIKVP
jgi:hypothetical protein